MTSLVKRDDVILALRKHYLMGIHCDHEKGTDRAQCYCTVWRGDEMPNVQAAVDSWILHVNEQLPIAPEAEAVQRARQETLAMAEHVAQHAEHGLENPTDEYDEAFDDGLTAATLAIRALTKATPPVPGGA